MNNQPNWTKIKQALKDSVIAPDFQHYSSTVFIGVSFDTGLEIFRYILEIKLPNHDETKSVFSNLEQYASGQQNKDILKELVINYEPFLKKLFEIIGLPFTQNSNKPKAPALGWCYNNLFSKLSVTNPQKDIFFASTVSGKIETPTHKSSDFASAFLTDSTGFGKALHSSYHLRNSNIHNDSPLIPREISEYITDCLASYFYFVFKYYTELCSKIQSNDLQPPQILTIKNLASLSGGAYNPVIENEVKRDNIIQTIEQKLNDLDVLFIEGEDGIGKTTILHQFVAKYPNNCFAYFVDGKDSKTYSNLSILKVLCNQINFSNKNYELEEVIDIRVGEMM